MAKQKIKLNDFQKKIYENLQEFIKTIKWAGEKDLKSYIYNNNFIGIFSSDNNPQTVYERYWSFDVYNSFIIIEASQVNNFIKYNCLTNALVVDLRTPFSIKEKITKTYKPMSFLPEDINEDSYENFI